MDETKRISISVTALLIEESPKFCLAILIGQKILLLGWFHGDVFHFSKKVFVIVSSPGKFMDSIWKCFCICLLGKVFLILVNRPVVACHCNLCFCSAQGSQEVRDCVPFPSNFFNIKGKTFTENLFCTSEVLLQNMEWNLCKQMLPIVGGYS